MKQKWKRIQADGYVRIDNGDGQALGLAADSPVPLLTVDGYAFKDLNQNGELDVYEDWRASTEERAADLIAQMQGAEKAAILAHGGWGAFTTEPLAEDDGSYTYLMAGGRGGVTRNIKQGGAAHAQWTNQIQAVAESCYYGIPAMISMLMVLIYNLADTFFIGQTHNDLQVAAVSLCTPVFLLFTVLTSSVMFSAAKYSA